MVDKELFEFKCGWCSAEFKQVVSSVGEGRAKVTSHVRCVFCDNFLKTDSGVRVDS